MSKATGKQKQTLRAARGRKKKVATTLWIGGSEELAEKLRDEEGRRQRQRSFVDVRGSEATDADRRLLSELEESVKETRQALEDSAIKFRLEAMGRKPYEKLLEEYPPTDEQMAQAKEEGEQINFNPETFPFALIDACAVEPVHEPGELVAWLKDDPDEEWNFAEIMDLFNAALSVNTGRTRVDLGKGL